MRDHILLPIVVLAICVGAGAARPAAQTARPFDADRAYGDLVQQCEFGPRVPGTKAHADCARWLVQVLYESADEVILQSASATVRGERIPLKNIIAEINPRAKRRVLLCAHWDSRPMADHDLDPESRKKPILGANDGASGVAVLLEIARALKGAPPKQRVTIVLFDGEDYGQGMAEMFLGSRFFAREWEGPPPDWAVLLDMVGDRDLRLPPEGFSLQGAPEVVERIWGAAEREGLSAFERTPGPSVMDDHVMLLSRGIPCIDVIDFEYPYWHTLADTPDKCSPKSLEQVGRALLRAIAEDEA
jgi:Zn-dependent M28 family amino/carboxypeptidase